jgi:glycosyltransferase involved in cell wall biosynthesis
MMRKISLVIPVYNEANNVIKLYGELKLFLEPLDYDYEIIFVDDGSRDASLEEIKKLAAFDAKVYFIELSRNFGHQHALKAGLDMAQGDCAISLDADLQHPPHLIPKLVELWEQGFDVVFTCREDDEKLSLFKRKSSTFFYALMKALSNLDLEKGTADFRLMDRRVVDAFIRFGENDLFIRGLMKWMGFRQTSVFYHPNARFSGKSKYNLRKMVSFAFKGITSFSTKPLILTAYLGIIFFLISVAYFPYALISYFSGDAVSGWTSLIMTVVFFGGLQLLMLGIIGLYLGKLVMQGKQRPLYLIRDSNHPMVNKTFNAYPERAVSLV